jgi:predicted lactoylglutathione lyase
MTMPSAKLTAVTFGVRDMQASARFYEAIGFRRKFSRDRGRNRVS